MKILRGKLSYLAAAVAVIWGAYGYFNGMTDPETALTAVWAGLSVFGLRRALPK